MRIILRILVLAAALASLGPQHIGIRLPTYPADGSAGGYTETFYVRANGDASAPETIAGAFDMGDFSNAANCNSGVDADDGKIGANDLVIILDDDGVFRTFMRPKCSGLAGKPITIQGEAGGSPAVYGSVNVTGWASTVGEEYVKAGVIFTPNALWEDGVAMAAGAEGALARGEFDYDAGDDEIHFRATDGADPDTHDMERGERSNTLQLAADIDYMDFSAITFKYSNTIGVDLQSANAGSPTEYITFTNVTFSQSAWIGVQLGHQAADRINPEYITFASCTFEYWDRTQNTNWAGLHVRKGDNNYQNITVRNSTFTSDVAGPDANTSQNAIWIDGGATILIEGNTITGSSHGIVLKSGTTGWIVRFNLVYDTGDDGIFYYDLNDGTGLTYYNVINSPGDNIIDLQGVGVDDFGSFLNNTGYNSINEAVSLKGDDGTTAIFKNNLFDIAQNPSTRFYLVLDTTSTVDPNDFVIDYNLYYDEVDSPGTATFALLESGGNKSWAQWKADYSHDGNSPSPVDPLLVNPGADDFHLQAGSPARNVGTDVSLYLDFDSVVVPQETTPAIGAYEYVP